MPVDATFLSAFLVGLLGGVHCVGMCGGIVGALSFGLPESVRARRTAGLPYILAYNLGRICSYTLAGALMGGVGVLAANLTSVHHAQQILQLLAGLFMSALGLYLAGWWSGIRVIERAGGVIWRRIQPFGRRLLPVHSPGQAFALGLLWGWLPCGLVYSVLIWAIAAGSSARGALLMLSFGVGTLPLLFAMGMSATRLAALVQRRGARAVAGVLVLAFGIYTLVMASAGLLRSL